MLPPRENSWWNARRVLILVAIYLRDGSWLDLNRMSKHTSCANTVQLLYRFLYSLFLAVDTNFKLKGKDHGIDDLELAPGWASFVEKGRYQEHIIQYVDQAEVGVLNFCLRICSS